MNINSMLNHTIEKIILTRDLRIARNLPVHDDNTDVVVSLGSGELFLASFFSYASIERYRIENVNSKYFLGGKYFWAKGMLLIDNCSKENIHLVVNHIFNEGNFIEIFIRIN